MSTVGTVESRFLVIARDQDVERPKAKRRSHGWERPEGPRGRGSDRAFLRVHSWQEGFATYLACGPCAHWGGGVLRGGHTKERRARPQGNHYAVCKLDPDRAGEPIALFR